MTHRNEQQGIVQYATRRGAISCLGWGRRGSLLGLLGACMLLGLGMTPAQGATSVLYGISTTGTLLSIDTNTGAVASVGNPGLSFNPGGLAYNPIEGNFYTIETNGLNRLIKIDRGTGAAQVVGTISNFFAPPNWGTPSVTGLTFGPNNQLYGTLFSPRAWGQLTHCRCNFSDFSNT